MIAHPYNLQSIENAHNRRTMQPHNGIEDSDLFGVIRQSFGQVSNQLCTAGEQSCLRA